MVEACDELAVAFLSEGRTLSLRFAPHNKQTRHRSNSRNEPLDAVAPKYARRPVRRLEYRYWLGVSDPKVEENLSVVRHKKRLGLPHPYRVAQDRGHWTKHAAYPSQQCQHSRELEKSNETSPSARTYYIP